METKIATSVYWKKQVKFVLGINIMITIAVIVWSILNKDVNEWDLMCRTTKKSYLTEIALRLSKKPT